MNRTSAVVWVDRVTARWVPTVLVFVAALLWLSNLTWKVPPDFGKSANGCDGLCEYTAAGAEHGVLPGSAWFFRSVVLPHLTVFGWLTVFVEAGLASALLANRFVRVAAVVGVLQSVAIGLAVANAEGEWYWSYGLMIALHLAILALAPKVRPISNRALALLISVYGVVVIGAHLDGGFTGDGSFSLFAQPNDFPGDFGRNVFPGSIALGLVFILIGAVAWRLGAQPPRMQSTIGRVVLALAAALLLTYRGDGLVIGLHARSTSVAVLAAVGWMMAAGSAGDDDPDSHRFRSVIVGGAD